MKQVKFYDVSHKERLDAGERIAACLAKETEVMFAFLYGSFISESLFRDIDLGVYVAGIEPSQYYTFENNQVISLNILANAQTSGELLITLPEDRAPALLNGLKAGGVPNAAIIGRATFVDRGLMEYGACIARVNADDRNVTTAGSNNECECQNRGNPMADKTIRPLCSQVDQGASFCPD